MVVDAAGYNHEHENGFRICRTNEQSSWLFLLLKTEGEFIIDGRNYYAKAGSFIVYSKGVAQNYGSIGRKYADDWVHFHFESDSEDFFRKLNIPLNVPVLLSEPTEISLLVRSVTYEFYSHNELYNEIIADYLNIIFKKISRQINGNRSALQKNNSEYYDKLLQIRTDVYNKPYENWNVDNVASHMSVSRSTFQHTYKNCFSTTFSADVIESRISRAKLYLSTTTLKINEISKLCGYSGDVFFMRQFKKIVGKTPTEYRQKL